MKNTKLIVYKLSGLCSTQSRFSIEDDDTQILGSLTQLTKNKYQLSLKIDRTHIEGSKKELNNIIALTIEGLQTLKSTINKV